MTKSLIVGLYSKEVYFLKKLSNWFPECPTSTIYETLHANSLYFQETQDLLDFVISGLMFQHSHNWNYTTLLGFSPNPSL